jgi:hypothetical protein
MAPAVVRAVGAAPAAQDDVEALLREAERVFTLVDWGEGKPQPLKYDFATMARNLAAALRAERERAEALQQEGDYLRGRKRHEERSGDESRGHLRRVLAHGWPEGTTGPACVREARAFLAGEVPTGVKDDGWRHFDREAQAHRDSADRWLKKAAKLEAERDVAKEDVRKALAAQNQAEAELASTKAQLCALEDGLEKLMVQLRGKGAA